MDGLEDRVWETAEKYKLLCRGDRVVAAVSGGADSVCLLALLARWRKPVGIGLRVLHVHHGIRGAEADRDADFVERFAGQLGIPCTIRRFDVRKIAREHSMSEEETGRLLRYQALEEEAEDWERSENLRSGTVKIAVAHHSGDQAETILHNLFRGSGLSGIKGIARERGRVIRPLLEVSRSEIVDWLEENGYSYVEDSTNTSLCYTRNRIRSRILPDIEKYVNRGAVSNILRFGRLAAQADEYLKEQARRWIGRYVEIAAKTEIAAKAESAAFSDMPAETALPGQAYIPAEPFLKEPEIIRSYVMMELLKELSGGWKDLGAVHVETAVSLAERRVGKQASLPYGLAAVREYEGIRIGSSGYLLKTGDVSGEIPAPTAEIREFPRKKGDEIPKNRYTKWFDCDRIKDTPVVRTRQTGDYISLSGGRHKALNRFMIDEKIPRQLRDQIPLLADGSHIMWVIGFRISDDYKLGPDTSRVLEVKIRNQCYPGLGTSKIEK